MKRWIGAAVLAVVVAFALGIGLQTVRAMEHPGRAEHPSQIQKAEEAAVFECPMHPEVRATWEAKCPKCGMKLTEAKKSPGMPMHMMGMGGMQKGEGAESMAGMMGKMHGMMMRCRMMMDARTQKTDPVGLLALRDQLELSEEQVSELQQIVETARQEAERVLTEQQKEKLEAMPDQPHSMMQMHRRMQRMMKGHMKEQPAPKEEQEREDGRWRGGCADARTAGR
ncbi:MAG: heavy metal-binding domain-containing protein [Candidatus Brocadiaceae bacterium]|jgi:hypothetical protein